MVALALVLTIAALAAIAVQLAVPRAAERRIHARLTERGGSAEVRVRAMPATRLLRNGGDRIEVRGRGLDIGLAGDRGEPAAQAAPTAGLGALDGFADVDIELTDFRTGPFAVSAFVLERRRSGPYAMATRAHVTPAELAALGLDALPQFPGGGLLGTVAGATPLSSRRIEVSLQIELISTAGALRVGTGGGTIAGYPAGPLATTIAAAVARRLEIVP